MQRYKCPSFVVVFLLLTFHTCLLQLQADTHSHACCLHSKVWRSTYCCLLPKLLFFQHTLFPAFIKMVQSGYLCIWLTVRNKLILSQATPVKTIEVHRADIKALTNTWAMHNSREGRMHAFTPLLCDSEWVWMDPPPFALQSRISFYWGLFTIRSWLKTLILSDWKRPHISRRKDMPFLRADWLWGREPYSTLLWRAFWTCRIGACLITLPSPVLKHLSFCVSIPPIIHHWSAVTKALGGHHENCCWYQSN